MPSPVQYLLKALKKTPTKQPDLPKGQIDAFPLPEDPIERAKHMGYNTDDPTYHWTQGGDWDVRDTEKSALDPSDLLGLHSGTKEAARMRGTHRINKYTDDLEDKERTFELLTKRQKPLLNSKGEPMREGELNAYMEDIAAQMGTDLDSRGGIQKVIDAIWAKHDSIPYINDIEDEGSTSWITPPTSTRKKAAAFATTAAALASPSLMAEEVEPAQEPSFLDKAIHTLETPARGIHALGQLANALRSDTTFDQALEQAVKVSKQPLDDTARMYGNSALDATGSPLTATAAHMLALSANPSPI